MIDNMSVSRALEIMRENLCKPLSISEIARRANTSARHLQRGFIEQCGLPPREQYRRMRLESGLRQLEHSDASITEIAYQCGFSDASHFTRVVREVLGVTPSVHREQSRRINCPVADQRPAEVTWRIGSPHGRDYFGFHGIRDFSRRVESRTAGRVRLQPYAFKELGLQSGAMLRALRSSKLDAVLLVPESNHGLTELGSLLPQGALADRNLNRHLVTPQYEVSLGVIRDSGLACLARIGDTVSHDLLLLSRQPVSSLAELRRHRLRHWSTGGAAAFNALGVKTEAASLATLAADLASGRVDAAICMPSFALAHNLQRYVPFVSPIIATTRNYPYLVVTRRERMVELPDEIRNSIFEVGEEMQYESDRLWETPDADRNHLELLGRSGFHLLERFRYEERAEIQDAMVAGWQKSCLKLGPQARAGAERISAAIALG